MSDCMILVLQRQRGFFQKKFFWELGCSRYSKNYGTKIPSLIIVGAQLFTASELPLRSVDFSNNQLRRLTERLFDGVEDTIEVIKFGNNLLGDNLDPVFTTGEFRNLKLLRQLDLSYNMLTVIEEGLLDGCTVLKVSGQFFYNVIVCSDKNSSISFG